MTICAIKAKHWVLRHYLWIAIGALALALIADFTVASNAEWQIRLSILGVPFSLLYFVQKQKMEELELFKRLFTEFNRRYDRLNEKLNAIRDKPPEKEIEDDERSTLFDYFNLCGEEYLFFSQGYIYPEVWSAWHNGMLIFYQNSRIKKLWEEELKTGSYYGLLLGGTSCGACIFRRFIKCSERRNNRN